MLRLPDKPSASLIKGIWFVFHVDSNIIRLWGSMLTGSQKLYINDKLLDVRTNLKNEDCYELKVDPNFYELKTMSSGIKGETKCLLLKNGTLQKTSVCRVQNNKKHWYRILFIFLFGISSISSAIYFKVDDLLIFYLLILFALSFLVSGMTISFVVTED